MIRHLAAAAGFVFGTPRGLLDLWNFGQNAHANLRGADVLADWEAENEVHDPPTKPLPVCDCEPMSADFDDEPVEKTGWVPVGEGCDCGDFPFKHLLRKTIDGGVTWSEPEPCTPKTPAASATTAVRGNPPGGRPPTSAGTDLTWIDYITPAIQDVLAVHEPLKKYGLIRCYHGCIVDSFHFECEDMQDWREHVAPLIAARLEDVTLALPENEAPQYIKPLQ